MKLLCVEHCDRQAVVAALASAALSSLDETLADLMDATVEAVARTLDVELVTLLEHDPKSDRFVLRACVGCPEDGAEGATPSDGLVAEARYTLGAVEPVVSEELRTETRFRGAALLVDHGVTSAISAVIPGDGHPFGVLAAHTSVRHRFAAPDCDFLRSAATILAAALLRRRREAALRASDERLRALVESSSDVISITGQDGTFHYVSPACERSLGYRPDDLVGKSYIDFVHPDDRPATETARARAAAESGSSHAVRARVQHVDGSWRTFEARFRNGLVVDGAPCYVVNARDITDYLWLEGQCYQAQKMEAVGRLASGVAHDFNNLLTVITGYSQLVLDTLEPGHALHRDLGHIANASQRAAHLTRQLLALGRRQALDAVNVDIAEAFAALEEMLGRIIGEDVALTCKVDPGVGRVHLDRSQLDHAILNLAVNARDAMPRGGRLDLSASTVVLDEEGSRRLFGAPIGRYVKITVRDNGEGMEPAIAAHVFDPFFTTKEVGKGTGLGLSMVYGFVKQSRGYITLSTAPGLGTAFDIYLPEVESTRRTGAVPASAASPRGGIETILIVEDESMVRAVAGRALTSLGYRVLEAPDGATARKIAADPSVAIDLLIVDCMLPDQLGTAVADTLALARPGLAILYVSGYGSNHGRFAEELRDMPFLEKPYSRDGLGAKVRELLDAARARVGVREAIPPSR